MESARPVTYSQTTITELMIPSYANFGGLKIQQKVVEVKEALFSEKKSGSEETASNAEKKSDKGFDF